MSSGTAKDVAEVLAIGGEIVGRTRLQKTFAVLEMTGLGFGFDFQYHKFGPYSDDLAVSVDRAVALGYISESERRAGWGGRYSVFSARANRSRPADVARDQLIAIAREANAVVLELAVTAAFLAKNGSVEPWLELASLKSEKATPDRLHEAKELYRAFVSVQPVPDPLPPLN